MFAQARANNAPSRTAPSPERSIDTPLTTFGVSVNGFHPQMIASPKPLTAAVRSPSLTIHQTTPARRSIRLPFSEASLVASSLSVPLSSVFRAQSSRMVSRLRDDVRDDERRKRRRLRRKRRERKEGSPPSSFDPPSASSKYQSSLSGESPKCISSSGSCSCSSNSSSSGWTARSAKRRRQDNPWQPTSTTFVPLPLVPFETKRLDLTPLSQKMTRNSIDMNLEGGPFASASPLTSSGSDSDNNIRDDFRDLYSEIFLDSKKPQLIVTLGGRIVSCKCDFCVQLRHCFQF